MKNNDIIVELLLYAPAPKVWRAITDTGEMKQWYFDLAEFIPEPGFIFKFTGGPSPERQYLHICEIKEVVPCKKLSYSWRYDGNTGESLVSFELSEQGEKTQLRLVHSGIDTFPADNPDFAMHNFEKGWHHIIYTSLKDYLEIDKTRLSP